MNLFKKIANIGKKIFSSKKEGSKSRKSSAKDSKSGKSSPKNLGKKGDSRKFNADSRTSGGRSANAPRKNGSTRRGHSKSPNSAESLSERKPLKPREPKIVPQPFEMSALEESIPDFAALGLSPAVLSAVKDMGYNSPTPIQSQAVPIVLSGADVIGTAQTGTGKTAAFALPIVNMLGEAQDKPRVLVLSPTRELASQTAEAFKNFSKYSPIETLLVQGGVSMERQIDALRYGVDVVVATPGRLLDLNRNRLISLKNIKWLVLDEVDRMFDMGFIEDVSNIIRYCPKERQTLFFSATMPDAVMRLSKWALTDPQRLDTGIASNSPADTIEHYIYPVDGIQKYDLLIEFLKSIEFDSLIVFTRTRIDADRIGEWLIGHDYKVSILHSDRTQRERDKALSDFKDRKTNILVATDIASRGLDINDVQYVINYNVPEHSEDYVHRIGRTGRANKDGTAITLYSSDETIFLKRIEDFINAKIERRKLDGFAYRNEPILIEETKRSRKRNR